MTWLRETWGAVRDTTVVIAQVITLGVLAMVLGLVALNAVLSRPAPAAPTPQSSPARPLAALVPTLVPSTATPTQPARPEPTVTLFQPPGFSFSGTPVGLTPTARAPEPTATPVPSTQPPAATSTPKPQPTATPAPRPATATPKPSAAANPTGQLMKVLPASDGLPARIRAEPNTRAPILIRVPLGATVEVVGQASGDELQPGNPKWWRIRWRDVTGYVYSTLLG